MGVDQQDLVRAHDVEDHSIAGVCARERSAKESAKENRLFAKDMVSWIHTSMLTYSCRPTPVGTGRDAQHLYLYPWLPACAIGAGNLAKPKRWLGHFGASFAKDQPKIGELVAGSAHLVSGIRQSAKGA